jgi:hypothetical protein
VNTWCRERLPRVVPASWMERWCSVPGGLAYVDMGKQLSLIITGEEHDGRRWIHMSMASPSRLPTWAELVDAKEVFLGRETTAVQVIPPRSKYINLHNFCLHLYMCIDEFPLPDFTRGTKEL